MPIVADGALIGVLDLDSPIAGALRCGRRGRLCRTDTASRGAARRHGKGRRRRVKDLFTSSARLARGAALRTGDPGMRKLSLSILAASVAARCRRRASRSGRAPAARGRGGHSWRGGGMPARHARPAPAQRRRSAMRGGPSIAARRQHGVRRRPSLPASGPQLPPSPAAARLRHPPFWFGAAIPHQQLADLRLRRAGATDQRWVRYYDDAYLIDRDGRVRRRALRHRLGPLWRGLGRSRTASPPITAAATDGRTTRIMPSDERWRRAMATRRPWRAWRPRP